MIRFGQRSDGGSVMVVGLGLEEGNLTRMQHGSPVFVAGASVQTPGHDWVIMSAAGEEDLKQRLESLATGLLGDRDDHLACFRHEDFYLMPILAAGRLVHAIGLLAGDMDTLRSGGLITYSLRSVPERSVPDGKFPDGQPTGKLAKKRISDACLFGQASSLPDHPPVMDAVRVMIFYGVTA